MNFGVPDWVNDIALTRYPIKMTVVFGDAYRGEEWDEDENAYARNSFVDGVMLGLEVGESNG